MAYEDDIMILAEIKENLIKAITKIEQAATCIES